MTKWLCPKCNSNMGFFTGLINFAEVSKGGEPRYTSFARCTSCDFETKRYDADDDEGMLDEIIVVEETKPKKGWFQKLLEFLTY